MTWENSAITITTLLPIVGALVIVVMPKEKDRLVRGTRDPVHRRGARAGRRDRDRLRLRQGRPAVRPGRRAGSARSAPGTTWGSTASRMPLYVLTFLLSFLCAIYTWRYVPDPGRTKAFLALMLLLETGMAGTFIAFDLILFFVFWEMVLVPMYFLIGIWGSANREYASIKFFLYTLFGSVFMLLGFLAMYFQGPDPHTFDMVAARRRSASAGGFTHDVPAGRLRRGGAGVRGEGADVAVPHVAARRAYRGAHDRLGAAGRRSC